MVSMGCGHERISRGQKGLPLSDECLAAMEESERAFWEDFLSEAKGLIGAEEEKGASMPYAPTSSLQEKYRKALTDYDGQKYCQVRQLQGIFSF